MVTIKDIARALSVSPSTVTRALADSPRISPRTRRRVKLKAEELGYVANSAAKLMRGQNSSLVGLLIPDIENSFYAQVAKNVSDVCNRSGFQLMLAVTEDNPVYEERHIRELVSARCAGIVIVPTAEPSEQSTSLLAGKNLAQLIRKNDALNANWYGIDDSRAMHSATRYLLDLRHQRIGFICGEEQLISANERYQGYVNALQERGIAIDETIIKRGPPNSRFAEKSAHQLLSLGNPPSAIISAGAGLSEGMLNAAASWSNDQRDEISLIGYSENNAFRWWNGSGLTTIDLPIKQITSELCTALLESVNSSAPAADIKDYHLYQSHLLLRGSTKPLT